MSIEYLPVGIACNLQCNYCYQDPMRNAGNISVPKDWEKAKTQLIREGAEFAVFGGEPLLASIEHLEEVWEFGYKQFGHNGIQTNGLLITDQHIELFKKYSVGVGISMDGPSDLNDARKAGDYTREATAQIHDNIERLCLAGIIPSIITTIHRGNADRHDKLARMVNWFHHLEMMGVKHLNLHILEVEQCNLGWNYLTQQENIEAFTAFYEFSKTSSMVILPFSDIRRLLTETAPSVTCVWNHCDPLTTAAVRGVAADGAQSNCGRTNKDGVNWVKSDSPGLERYVVLHQTPQKFGGCRDCRYFLFCKGQCPGTAIDGDWRNRTADCETWYALFSMIETELMEDGQIVNTSDKEVMRRFEEQMFSSPKDTPHGDAHGDSPHGDAHGDSDERGVPVQWRD